MEYVDFRKVASKGAKVPNAEIIDEMKALDVTDPDHSATLAQLMTLLVTKKPLVVRSVRMGPSAWGAHIKTNNLDKTHLMAQMPTIAEADWITRSLIQLYEENFNTTREFIHQISKFNGENKILSIRAFMIGLHTRLKGKPLETEEELKELLSGNLIDTVREMRDAGDLKYITGQNLVNTFHYYWLREADFWDRDFVANADVAYDLGGGLTTTLLETIFDRDFICLDIESPENVINYKDSIHIHEKYPFTLDEYVEKCANQNWINFDVTKDAFDTNHNSYVITSFGFTSSTVVINDSNVDDPWIETTYDSCKAVADLVATGKDVYFFIYSKPRLTIYSNKVLIFKFSNKQLVDCHIEADPFSMSDKNFGRRAGYNVIRRK